MALLTHTSIGPSSRLDVRGGALDLLGIGHVGRRDDARTPCSSTSRRAASSRSAPRAMSPTCAPRRAISRAVARPIPAEAPVMTTTLPWSDMGSALPVDRARERESGAPVGPVRFRPACRWT